METKRKKWWFYGAFGAVLLGSGLSLAIESSWWKHSETPDWYWILGGTAGIGLCLSGVVLLIKAGILNNELKNKKR